MTLRPITSEYERSDDIESLHLAGDAELYAGGTDLIPLIRNGVLDPASLVDVKRTGLSRTIEPEGDGWTIGALATLADLEDHAGLAESHPAIGQAVRQSATRQIRHRATVGGNLLQRPRCSYFRDAEITCWMKGGATCPAKSGRNEHHGLDGGECVAVQPSDLASVLTAMGATISIGSPGSDSDPQRPIDQLLVAPSASNRRLHSLGDDEVIQAIHVPSTPGQSLYLKAMDRAVWQFALVGLAAVANVGPDGAVTHARLVASGVAAEPHVLKRTSSLLVGHPLDASRIAAAADAASDGLEPLSENAYKLQLLGGLVQRALASFDPR